MAPVRRGRNRKNRRPLSSSLSALSVCGMDSSSSGDSGQSSTASLVVESGPVVDINDPRNFAAERPVRISRNFAPNYKDLATMNTSRELGGIEKRPMVKRKLPKKLTPRREEIILNFLKEVRYGSVGGAQWQQELVNVLAQTTLRRSPPVTSRDLRRWMNAPKIKRAFQKATKTGKETPSSFSGDTDDSSKTVTSANSKSGFSTGSSSIDTDVATTQENMGLEDQSGGQKDVTSSSTEEPPSSKVLAPSKSAAPVATVSAFVPSRPPRLTFHPITLANATRTEMLSPSPFPLYYGTGSNNSRLFSDAGNVEVFPENISPVAPPPSPQPGLGHGSGQTLTQQEAEFQRIMTRTTTTIPVQFQNLAAQTGALIPVAQDVTRQTGLAPGPSSNDFQSSAHSLDDAIRAWRNHSSEMARVFNTALRLGCVNRNNSALMESFGFHINGIVSTCHYGMKTEDEHDN